MKLLAESQPGDASETGFYTGEASFLAKSSSWKEGTC
jgi:hypothetical protein